MPETLHRITYDATVDDVVDVALRLVSRTRAFQGQIRQNVIIAGIIGAMVMAVWGYFGTSPGSVNPIAGGTVVVGFGLAVALLFKRFLMTEVRKQHRKVVAEQFGGKPAIPSELELRSDVVWVRQGGVEMTFPWNLCTGIQDNADDVQLDFSPGICVIRSRYFSSSADRQSFVETARRLAGK